MFHKAANFNFLKKAIGHSAILALSFLLLGVVEFYNNILFKLFETNTLPHNLMAGFFPILLMYLLKSIYYVCAFLLILAIVALTGNKLISASARKSEPKNPTIDAKHYLSVFADLLVPALLVYLLLFEYESSPLTLSYYFYHLSARFSSVLKSAMSFSALNWLLKMALALPIAFIFIIFRLSTYWKNYLSVLLFTTTLAGIPGLVFFVHYFDNYLITAILFLLILLLFAFMIFQIIPLFKSKRRRLGVFLSIVLLLAIWGNLHFYKITKNSRLNVVHIILDTLRMESFNQNTMPFLYALKDKGVYFPNSYSSSDNTVTSHNAIYYGKYPSLVGLEKGPFPATTMMEVLRSNNYHTAVVSANGRFCLVNGFGKGADDFYEAWKTENHVRNMQMMTDYHLSSQFQIVEKYLAYYQKVILNKTKAINKEGMRPEAYRYYNYEPASVVNEFVKAAVQENPPSQPLYLFVNYLDPHSPYLAPDPENITHVVQELKTSLPDIYEKLGFDRLSVADTTIFHQIMLMWNEVDSLKDKAARDKFLTFCYEENLRYLDGRMKELFDYFDKEQMNKNTLFIITSDHGESIGEHGLYEHGNKRLYNQEIQVPLFFLFPEKFGALIWNKVIEINTQSVDFFPTLIDLLGFKTDFKLSGKSLLPYIFSTKKGGDVGYSISEYTGVSAITDHHFKLITTDKTTELYHLAEDSKEEDNLAAVMPEKVAELKKKLEELRKTTQPVAPRSANAPQQEFDPETIRQLKTLGYIK
jgi:arylsulfatase A-like enzyme